MKAIIVAGGRGERLRPITNTIPKPMVEVNGKPILLHIINLFNGYGIKNFIIAFCYLPEVIVSYFGDGSKFGVKITYTYENPKKPLGTAGAISLAKNLITGTFIVTYADILRDLDIKKMVDFHNSNKAFSTINIYQRESKDARSKIVIDYKNQVIKFIERPTENELQEDYILTNGSFYILEPKIFKFIPENTKYDFGLDVFPELLKTNKNIYAYPTAGYFIDIGNHEKLEYARKSFSNI